MTSNASGHSDYLFGTSQVSGQVSAANISSNAPLQFPKNMSTENGT